MRVRVQERGYQRGDASYVIDADKCTECVGWFEAPRCAEVCPVGAPQPDSDNVETKEQLLEKFKKLNPGETPAEGTY